MGIADKLKDKVLVPGPDHSYTPMNVGMADVVYNETDKTFTEYHGDDYLSEGDIVIKARTAQ